MLYLHYHVNHGYTYELEVEIEPSLDVPDRSVRFCVLRFFVLDSDSVWTSGHENVR